AEHPPTRLCVGTGLGDVSVPDGTSPSRLFPTGTPPEHEDLDRPEPYRDDLGVPESRPLAPRSR
ncbi:unnamed protein product, partial [Musa textilis]